MSACSTWKNLISVPLTEAEILLRRQEQHSTKVNSPSRRIYTASPTLLVWQVGRWRGFRRSPVSPCLCVWVCECILKASASVLSYSMCLWLWGGAPWRVNIGPAGERGGDFSWSATTSHRLSLSQPLSLTPPPFFSPVLCKLKQN